MTQTRVLLLISAIGLGSAWMSSGAELVPAGTILRVRTSEFIDVDSSQAGMKFRGALDDPIMFGGDVVIPRGADVQLVASNIEQGGRMKGSDLIQLKIDSIVVRGRTYPVATSFTETKSAAEGKKTTRKILGAPHHAQTHPNRPR